jgi:prepilin-type N-terminal cleavage/methylation domain-containing protein
MEARMRLRRGFTLIEVLVAMAIFATVLALVSAGIVQALRLQALNEANTTLQAKLRRVTEVISQDLRSAVFGGILAEPYASNATAISFALAAGGVGYQVLPGGGGSFPNRNNLVAVVPVTSAAETNLQGRRALMINADGEAIEFTVTNVVQLGGANSQRYNVVHAGCNNTIAYEPPVMLTQVEALGFSFDAASGELRREVSGGGERVLAFDLTGFELEYVYDGSDGTVAVLPAPRGTSARPLRREQVAGVDFVLTALRVMVSAEAEISGRTVERRYVSQIALPRGGAIDLRSVVSCP